MKALIAVSLIAISLAALAFAPSARAQWSIDSRMDLPPVFADEPSFLLDHASGPSVANRTVLAVSRRADGRRTTTDELMKAVGGFVSDHAVGSSELLQAGKTLEMTAPVNASSNVMDQHSVKVHANYDARPI